DARGGLEIRDGGATGVARDLVRFFRGARGRERGSPAGLRRSSRCAWRWRRYARDLPRPAPAAEGARSGLSASQPPAAREPVLSRSIVAIGSGFATPFFAGAGSRHDRGDARWRG